MAASVPTKQPCINCDKGGGVASCGGCQQWFCAKHFNEHRQELALEIDNLGEEHDLLQHDLIQIDDAHDLLSYVDDWEQTSMMKIQATAEQARRDIRQYLNDNKEQMKRSLNQVTDELKSVRQSDDYTEIELKKWLIQMKEIRMMLDKPSTIHVTDNTNPQSIIHLIQVKQNDTTDKTARSSEITEDVIRQSR